MDRHIHRYQRVNIGQTQVVIDPEKNRRVVSRKEVWVMKCNFPHCSHYTRMSTKLSAPLLRENAAICNRCQETFLLNKRALRMEKPCCDECVNRKKKPLVESAELFFRDLEKSIK